jgi:hypothetical protein
MSNIPASAGPRERRSFPRYRQTPGPLLPPATTERSTTVAFCAGTTGFTQESLTSCQSSEQDIQLQSNLGGGIGRYLKNSNHATIIVFGGLAWQNTRYSPTTGFPQTSQSTAAGLLGADAELLKFDKTNLTISGTVFPAISQAGRVYTNLNATYYIKFWSDFTWSF